MQASPLTPLSAITHKHLWPLTIHSIPPCVVNLSKYYDPQFTQLFQVVGLIQCLLFFLPAFLSHSFPNIPS